MDAGLSVSQNYMNTILKKIHQIFKSFKPGATFDKDGMGCNSVAGLPTSTKFTQYPFEQVV